MAPVEIQPAWYREFGAAEWSRADWEIQQRVNKLTQDEIPALEHKAGAGNVMAQTVLGLAYREGIERARSSGRTIRLRANNTSPGSGCKRPPGPAPRFPRPRSARCTTARTASSATWPPAVTGWNRRPPPAIRARLDLLQLNLETTSKPSQMGPQAQEALRSLFDSIGVPTGGNIK